MCPVCITTAVLIASGATSTSGLAAVVISKLGVKNAFHNHRVPTPTNLSRKENRAGEITADTNQRRDQDGNQHD
jgi:hypothetical protein